jgi:LysM repeat protein
MKKEVQALINRRRARMVPAILAGMAAVIVIIGAAALVVFFTQGPGQVIIKGTPTPTVTQTFTPLPPTATLAATPTPTDTPLPTETPGPSPTPTVVVYVVQQYDTLFDIALKFKVDVEALKLANNLTSDVLSVGQQLTIPSGEVPTTTPSPLPTGLGRGAKIKYRVLFGDTLETIAIQFNSKVDEIIKVNADPKNPTQKLSNDTLRAGMEITVPVNLVTPTPTPRPSVTPKP